MTLIRRATLGMAMTFGIVTSGLPALAETNSTITVSLWDKGDAAMDMLGDMDPLAIGSGADMMLATMGITIDLASVPAGDVTFAATNDSAGMIHEMIVSPLDSATSPLPYLADEMEVDEDASGAIGEVSELDPGASGSLTLHLKPGTYALYCNIPGHYAMGMWTILTVTQ